MAEKIPVNLKYNNPQTQINDHLIPTTRAELVEETEEKQFVSARDKRRFSEKQDALGYTPINQAGDTMQGPLILSNDAIVNNRQAVTKQYVDKAMADLVGGAPTTLDTLYELATAIKNDPNFVISLSSTVGQKIDKTDASILPTANKLLYLDQNGELNTNAMSATKLKNAFTLSLTGDASTVAIAIDGSKNIEAEVTIEQLSAADVERIFNQT